MGAIATLFLACGLLLLRRRFRRDTKKAINPTIRSNVTMPPTIPPISAALSSNVSVMETVVVASTAFALNDIGVTTLLTGSGVAVTSNVRVVIVVDDDANGGGGGDGGSGGGDDDDGPDDGSNEELTMMDVANDAVEPIEIEVVLVHGKEQLRSCTTERKQTSAPMPWSSVTVTVRFSRMGEPGHALQVLHCPTVTLHIALQQTRSSGPPQR